MLAGFILAIREGLEAALIVGVVLSVLRKMELRKLNFTVWLGVLSAGLVSILAGLSLNWVGAKFDGQGEMIFEGFTMLLAAGILTWMIFWMRSQDVSLNQKIQSDVRLATEMNGRKALFILAFLAVVREGIELVLFLLAIRLNSNPVQEYMGAILGLVSAAVMGWVIFNTSRKLSLARFFQTTNIFLAVFAAGLIGLGVHEFNELGWIPSIIDHVWNLGGLIPDGSTTGQILKALIGYNSSPSLSQVLAYFGFFFVLAGTLAANHKISTVSKPAVNE